jgi:GST-like protein
MASYPWIARHEWQGQKLEDYPNLKRWYDAISARPAVQQGMAIPKV